MKKLTRKPKIKERKAIHKNINLKLIRKITLLTRETQFFFTLATKIAAKLFVV